MSLAKLFEYNSINWLVEYLESLKKFGQENQLLIQSLNAPTEISISDGNLTQVYPIATVFEVSEKLSEAKDLGYIGLLELKKVNAAERIIALDRKIRLSDAIREHTGLHFYQMRILEKLSADLEKASADPAFSWIKALPLSFIEDIFQMITLDWTDIANQRDKLSFWLQTEIFNRLPDAIRMHLAQNAPKRTYRRKNYKEQEVTFKPFAEFLQALRILMKTSGHSQQIFTQLADKLYPANKERSIVKLPDNAVKLSVKEEALKAQLF